MGMMTMWMMAMTHRMMKMKITPIVVSCAAWPGEAEASESTRLTLSAEHDCMRLSNGVAWRARSGWGVEGGVVPNERPCNPRGPDSDGDAQALPPGIIGWHERGFARNPSLGKRSEVQVGSTGTIVLVMSFQFNCTSDETTWKKRPLRFKILLKLIWTVIIVDDNSASRSSHMHTYPSARSGSMLKL